MKHTPAPWRSDEVSPNDNLTFYIRNNQEKTVAICCVPSANHELCVRPVETVRANARLIAAAPLLLEAAINMILQEDEDKLGREDWDELKLAVVAAQGAILVEDDDAPFQGPCWGLV